MCDATYMSLFFIPKKSIPMTSTLLPKGSHKSIGWSNGFGTDVSNMVLMVIDNSPVYLSACPVFFKNY